MSDLQTRDLSDTQTRVAWVALFTMVVGVMAWMQTLEKRLAERSRNLRSAGFSRGGLASGPWTRRAARTTFIGQARRLLRQLRTQRAVAPRVDKVSFETHVRAEIDRLVGKGVYGGAKEQL